MGVGLMWVGAWSGQVGVAKWAWSDRCGCGLCSVGGHDHLKEVGVVFKRRGDSGMTI